MTKSLIFSLMLFITNLSIAQEKVQWISFEKLDSLLIIEPRETILFLHTDWCVYCRKMEKEIFSTTDLAKIINKRFYAVSFDAETVESIQFDQSTWSTSHRKKIKGEIHPLAKVLLTNYPPIYPTIIRLDKNFNILKIEQKYMNIKSLRKFIN